MAGPSRELYRHGTVVVGSFRCNPADAAFAGGWMERPTIVFPRTCVKITQQGTSTVVADANTVMLYRGLQEYARAAVDTVGDHCEWFEVDPTWLREAATPFDPELNSPDAPPLRHTHATADPRAYSLQRALTRLLSKPGAIVDPMLVEETLLRLIDLIIPSAYRSPARVNAPVRVNTTAAHQEVVDDAKVFLSLNFAHPLTLADVGSAVGSSRFHLARMFRRSTGHTLHQHLTNLRLRAALNLLDEPDRGIADIAVAVGFSTHSHFTQAFHSTFGLTPNAYRRHPEHVLVAAH